MQWNTIVAAKALAQRCSEFPKARRSVRKQFLLTTILPLMLPLCGTAAVTEGSAAGAMKPLRSVQFSPDGDVKCLSSALETGDPKTGPSTWILKAPAGCVIPWHFHTAQEQ